MICICQASTCALLAACSGDTPARSSGVSSLSILSIHRLLLKCNATSMGSREREREREAINCVQHSEQADALSSCHTTRADISEYSIQSLALLHGRQSAASRGRTSHCTSPHLGSSSAQQAYLPLPNTAASSPSPPQQPTPLPWLSIVSASGSPHLCMRSAATAPVATSSARD